MADVAARLTILFVCTGNVHRSPLAERLLAARLPEARVHSAGTMAQHITGMHPVTRSVLEQLGGNGAGFTSRRLTPGLVEEADLVLGFDREHRETAVRLWPVALRKCFTVKEFLRLARGAGEVVLGSASAHGEAAPPREVISRAVTARGSVAPVSQAADEIADPCGAPYDVLLACGREIDGATATLAALLLERGRAQGTECLACRPKERATQGRVQVGIDSGRRRRRSPGQEDAERCGGTGLPPTGK